MSENSETHGYKLLCSIQSSSNFTQIERIFRTKEEAIEYKLIIQKIIKAGMIYGKRNYPIEIENNIVNSDHIEFVHFSILQIDVKSDYEFNTLEGLKCEFQQK